MNRDRYLPGFAPAYVRLEVVRSAEGGWDVHVTATDTHRQVLPTDRETYPGCSAEEALDVVVAELDALNLS